MGSNGHRLQPAIQVAQRREDSAAQALADVQRRLTEQQRHLQQLLEFRREYSDQLQSNGHGGITALRLQTYMAFLARLDRSIAQCQQSLESFQKEFQRKRQLWLQSHAKTQALEGLIQLDHQKQEQLENRREQTDSDERNLRSYRQFGEDSAPLACDLQKS
jgi:flagellar FliJ protein